MKTITKFDPLSVMKISAIAYGLMGLVEGALISVFFSAARFANPSARPMPPGFSVFFGGFAIIVFPILFALVGAISAGIGAAIYNVAARYVGGIQVEVE